MKTKDFYYDLPKELIAQHPEEKRDHSRLLVLDKESGEMEHKHFYDIIDYLKKGDLLVLNDTKAVSYTHLTLPTTLHECRSRWSPYH